MSKIKAVGNSIANMVAPPRCMGCLCENTWFCISCRKRMIYRETSCLLCGKDYINSGLSAKSKLSRRSICDGCVNLTSMSGVVVGSNYNEPLIQRGIHWLKYKGISEVAKPLSTILLPKLINVAPIAQLASDAMLVPIPLHSRKERARGFNQSKLIAEALSGFTNIPISDCLLRTRATWTQAKLPTNLRLENMKSAFSLIDNKYLKNKIVLIVDDVTTTGSTLSLAIDALKMGGVNSKFWGIALAKG